MKLLPRSMYRCVAFSAKDLNVVPVIYPAMLLLKNMMGLQ